MNSAKKPKTLLEIQRDFLSHLYDEKNLSVASAMLPYSRLEALARLDVYRNNVFGNFSSVLSSVFSVTKKILGEKKFDLLCEKYIKLNYSDSGNLDEYGEFFPEFLNKTLKQHKINYLSDLATLELAYYKSLFNRKIKNDFPLEQFKKISPENFSKLTFTINPSLVLFSSKFPIYTIWNKEKKSSNKKGEFILVAKTAKPYVEKISEVEFLFLIDIAEGNNLYKTYQKLCNKTKKEIDIGKMVNHFIENLILIDFKIKT